MWKYKAQQNENELRDYVNLLKDERITSYLEIGCKWGGTLYRVSRILPDGAKIFAVDMPTPGSGTEASLRACVKELCDICYDAHLLLGDSTSEAIINEVTRHAPFDACLIDANHTEKYVRADWANYGPLARVVAFHDVSYNRPQHNGRMPIEVPKVWNEIKQQRRAIEIRHEPADNGFGVIFQ